MTAHRIWIDTNMSPSHIVFSSEQNLTFPNLIQTEQMAEFDNRTRRTPDSAF